MPLDYWQKRKQKQCWADQMQECASQRIMQAMSVRTILSQNKECRQPPVTREIIGGCAIPGMITALIWQLINQEQLRLLGLDTLTAGLWWGRRFGFQSESILACSVSRNTVKKINRKGFFCRDFPFHPLKHCPNVESHIREQSTSSSYCIKIPWTVLLSMRCSAWTLTVPRQIIAPYTWDRDQSVSR